jgi:serine/threonine protein kinase
VAAIVCDVASSNFLIRLCGRRHIVELILACNYSFKGRRWKRISKPAKEFVEDLLVLDPEDRATAESAYRSTWLNRRQMVTVRNPNAEETEKTQQALFHYAGYSKLKKLVRGSALCSVACEH